MNYAKAILSGLAAITVAELVPGPWSLRLLGNSKAIGMFAVAGGLLESFFSPLFWILAILLFVAFVAASRLGSRPLRIVLFWIPTVTVAVLCCGFVALITYLFIHFRTS